MKWSIHPKGYDSGIKPCGVGFGITILIEGQFWTCVRESADDPWQEYRLTDRGDFITSLGGLDHRYRAEEDCTLLTVRLTRRLATQV